MMDQKTIVVVAIFPRLESSKGLRNGRTAFIVASQCRPRSVVQAQFFDSELGWFQR